MKQDKRWLQMTCSKFVLFKCNNQDSKTRNLFLLCITCFACYDEHNEHDEWRKAYMVGFSGKS